MNYRKQTHKTRFARGIALLFCSVILANCTTQQPKKTGATAYPQDQSGAPVTNHVPPPPLTPEPPLGSTLPQQERPVEKPRIALVLGGAGVASFATVGILKRLYEEGIDVDVIIATGWPGLFSVGNCYMKSVHDLEWFAMHLKKEDFQSSSGLFASGQEFFASQDRLNSLVQKAFPSKELSDCANKIPVVLATNNVPPPGDGEIYERGDYRNPLVKTMAVPGVQQVKLDGDGLSRLQSADANEAFRRGAKVVFYVDMYDDYLEFLKKSKADSKEAKLRQQYLSQIQSSSNKEKGLAQITGKVKLNKGPGEFEAQSIRTAIVAGQKEAARMIRELRKMMNTR